MDQKTTVWLTLEPRWRRDYGHVEAVLEGFEVSKMTKSPPRGPHGPVIALELIVPDSVFMPMRPTVTIEVPEHMIGEPRIEVQIPEGEDADETQA